MAKKKVGVRAEDSEITSAPAKKAGAARNPSKAGSEHSKTTRPPAKKAVAARKPSQAKSDGPRTRAATDDPLPVKPQPDNRTWDNNTSTGLSIIRGATRWAAEKCTGMAENLTAGDSLSVEAARRVAVEVAPLMRQLITLLDYIKGDVTFNLIQPFGPGGTKQLAGRCPAPRSRRVRAKAT